MIMEVEEAYDRPSFRKFMPAYQSSFGTVNYRREHSSDALCQRSSDEG